MNLSTRESYHDYVSRRLKEVGPRPEKTVQERDREILELKQRIRNLEDDMSRILNRHE